MKAPLKDWLSDFAGLLFPRRCASCDTALMRLEKVLCMECHQDLPLARSASDPENRVERLFHGKLQLRAAASLLLFDRAGMVQRMLHRLKYQHDLEIGHELGRMMAQDLAESGRFKDLDALVAVPLHATREYQRGYNQSQILADAMAAELHLPCITGALIRHRSTRSQTKRGRLSRWANVKEAFEVKRPGVLLDKHILLVDDVVTTGATIEGCMKALSVVPGLRASLYTAACA